MNVRPNHVVKPCYKDMVIDINSIEVNQENLDMLFNMMYNRQMIWKRRFINNQPAPWTDDEILSKYKFCNLYRELDRSCQWEIRNILLEQQSVVDVKNIVWKLMVYRTFNNPETFERAKDKWLSGIPAYDDYDEDEFAEHINNIRDAGINPFTNAYNIAGSVKPGDSIDDQFTHTVIPNIHKSMNAIMGMAEIATAPEQLISFLMTLPSVSSFMAHEYYQDFTYIPIYTDLEFMKFDQNDYTNLGPGSNQGVKLIFPSLKPKERVRSFFTLQSIAADKLREIGEANGDTEIYTSWDKDLGCYIMSDECNLTLNQIEGALCEFSKYYRIKHNLGNPRCPEFVPKTLAGIIAQRKEYTPDEFISKSQQEQRRRGRPSLAEQGLRPYKHESTSSILLDIRDMLKSMDNKIDKLKREIDSLKGGSHDFGEEQ